MGGDLGERMKLKAKQPGPIPLPELRLFTCRIHSRKEDTNDLPARLNKEREDRSGRVAHITAARQFPYSRGSLYGAEEVKDSLS